MYDAAPTKDGTNEGLICVINVKYLKDGYKSPEYQLFRVEGGFGASPDNNGNCTIGTFCADGEHGRWEKHGFIGVGDNNIQRIGNQMLKEVKKL